MHQCTAIGKRKLDYSAVEVNFDVMRSKLQNILPRPLPLTKSAEMTEGLNVGDMLYIVHYPKEPIPYIRYENAEQICLLLGKLYSGICMRPELTLAICLSSLDITL